MRQIDLKKVPRAPGARGARARPASPEARESVSPHCRASAARLRRGGLSARSRGRALAAEALPKLGADLTQSSVSGLSSGAFMAVQIQVAHASDIVGAGIVAGGPFACAESSSSRAFPFWPTAVTQNAAQALYRCMKTDWGEPDPAASAKRAKELADAGAIDPIAGLAADNVYLFSGNEDQTVTRPVVRAAADFYKKAGVDPGNISLIEKEGGHAFLTEEGGAACGISAAPYVSDCNYNQAQAILAWIYGPLVSPLARAFRPLHRVRPGRLFRAWRRVRR